LNGIEIQLNEHKIQLSSAESFLSTHHSGGILPTVVPSGLAKKEEQKRKRNREAR